MAEKQDKAGCGMQIFAFLLLAGLILLVGWFGSRQCDKWAAENEAEYLSKPIQQVHIRELLEAYDQNVANADAKYGNARLMVTGTVTQVYPDGTIRLDAGAHKYRYSTGVIMEKEHYDWLLELRKGQTIRVECAQVNLISATDLVAADCRRPEPTTGRNLTTTTPQSTTEKHRATIDTRRSEPILPTPNTSMTELLQFTTAPPTYVPPVTTRPTTPTPTVTPEPTERPTWDKISLRTVTGRLVDGLQEPPDVIAVIQTHDGIQHCRMEIQDEAWQEVSIGDTLTVQGIHVDVSEDTIPLLDLCTVTAWAPQP